MWVYILYKYIYIVIITIYEKYLSIKKNLLKLVYEIEL